MPSSCKPKTVSTGALPVFLWARRPFSVGQTTGTLGDRAGLLCPSYGADTGHGGRADLTRRVTLA